MTVDPRSILKREHALRIHMVNETKNTQIIETDIATDAIVLGIDRNNQAKITSNEIFVSAHIQMSTSVYVKKTADNMGLLTSQ